MPANLEQTLLSVWRQALIEDGSSVTVEGKRYPVKRTNRSRLRQIDFEFEGQQLRGLEQNPNTNSRWALLAREGQKVMQFLSAGKYVANVADGKLQFYGRR
jgi:fructose-1,6-bisphosphatase/inositol monophosphatase family enzyme